jgi:hypothetical protein
MVTAHNHADRRPVLLSNQDDASLYVNQVVNVPIMAAANLTAKTVCPSNPITSVVR